MGGMESETGGPVPAPVCRLASGEFFGNAPCAAFRGSHGRRGRLNPPKPRAQHNRKRNNKRKGKK